MPDIDTVLGWRGRTVRDREGEKVGTLGELYLDREDDRPAYAGVLTGLFRRRQSVVPLEGIEEVGDDLKLPYLAQQVRDAPNVDPDIALSEEEEQRLSEHYGAPLRTEGDEREMVRSEEEVEIGVRPSVHKERVRLRKYMVTENVETTVPVRREEIRVERDGPPESGRVVEVQDAGEAAGEPTAAGEQTTTRRAPAARAAARKTRAGSTTAVYGSSPGRDHRPPVREQAVNTPSMAAASPSGSVASSRATLAPRRRRSPTWAGSRTTARTCSTPWRRSAATAARPTRPPAPVTRIATQALPPSTRHPLL
jgi:hypothetical protein